GVSKTVNMRNEASVDEVRSVYLLAWKLGCKGITVYRDKSKAKQVIYFGVKAARKMTEKPKEIHERIVAEPKKFRLEIRESRIVDGFNDISCPTCEL
ncbi:MAG: ribonucleoside-diphosphate reductase, adenosylcobalamin-dependent, partial [Thermoprotei archaeon]